MILGVQMDRTSSLGDTIDYMKELLEMISRRIWRTPIRSRHRC